MTSADFGLPHSPIAQTFGQRVAGMIREAIIRGELASGQVLRQEELAARFHISRIPLRDALQQLEAEGFVVILPYRGALVAPVSATEAREIFDLMIVLHPLALRQAFPSLTAEALDRAEQILDVRDHAADAGQWSRLTEEFFATLLAPARRPLLQSMLKDLHDQSVRYAHLYFPAWTKTKSLRSVYRAVIRSFRKGDVEGGVQAVEKGYAAVSKVIIDLLGNLAEGQSLPHEESLAAKKRPPRRKS